ncbi:Y-family DNA polymerase [Kangiella sp. TOML190]|uniref:Y-family DNA polymerase n=1 Tax=Kangiella sp. TOML190 TaxID=2931351 RepID=UPI00203B7B3F|nr:Y-family DNA polymerase [Kangiella sp. TOML190]
MPNILAKPQISYALCDVNSFYVSCERIFRPDLAKKPVIVLSNNDGCIISMSDEAKALGIGMAVPYHQAKDIIERHQVTTFSSNYGLYGDISNRFNAVLGDYCDLVAPYSVDESFLRFDGFQEDLTKRCLHIKQELKRSLSLPVCIGLGPTKTLAKVANHYAKKHKQSSNGVVDLHCSNQRQWILQQIPVRKIWGIGSRLAIKLNHQNIRTAWDLHNADFKVLQRIFSVNMERMVLELRGQACLNFEQLPQPKKSILNSRSFGKRITAYSDLKEALSYHATRCSEKLRAQNSLATAITLFLYAKKNHQARSYHHHPQITVRFPAATDDTGLFVQAVEKGLRRLYQEGTYYKKAGILLTGLTDKQGHQSDLFVGLAQRPELMQSIDSINSRFGKDAVKFASLGVSANWAMRANSFSARYTSRWQDILQITAR